MPGPDQLGQGVLGRAQVVGDEPLGEALRDDVRDRLAEELVAAVAELLLGLDVEQHDLAGLVDDDHRVGRRLEQAAVLGRRLLDGLLARRPRRRRAHSRPRSVAHRPSGRWRACHHAPSCEAGPSGLRLAVRPGPQSPVDVGETGGLSDRRRRQMRATSRSSDSRAAEYSGLSGRSPCRSFEASASSLISRLVAATSSKPALTAARFVVPIGLGCPPNGNGLRMKSRNTPCRVADTDAWPIARPFTMRRAGVAELADAADLKSAARKGVRVRVPAPAPVSASRDDGPLPIKRCDRTRPGAGRRATRSVGRQP